MARILRNLRIDEVSACLKGAGEGTRVLIGKSDDTLRHRKRLRKMFGSIDYAKATVSFENATPPEPREGPDDVDDVDDDYSDDAKVSPALERMVAAMIEADPQLSREHAIHCLLHTARGRSLAQHMTSTTKGHPMDRNAELQAIAKEFGVARLAKLLVAENNAHSITEHELTKLIDDEAQKTRKAGERPATAFARFYSAPENLELRKAVQISKGTSDSPYPYPRLLDVQPTFVGGKDATDVNNDGSKAYEQLVAMAEELRQRSPTLTPAQAFERIFTEQANSALAARAHRRPAA